MYLNVYNISGKLVYLLALIWESLQLIKPFLRYNDCLLIKLYAFKNMDVFI